MSVSQAEGRFYFECDGNRCPEVVDCSNNVFAEALTEMREADWKVIHTGKTWQHFCPSCQEIRDNERRANMLKIQQEANR